MSRARAKKKAARFLDERQQRDLWGIALCGLGLLLALSLVPVGIFGPRGGDVFPSGNIVGVLGQAFAAGTWIVFGICFILLPVVPVVWGLVSFDKLTVRAGGRLTVLLGGILLLLPPTLFVASRPVGVEPAGTGWLGPALGSPLAAGLGWMGALLLLLLLLAGVSVASLGWNPMRAAVGGGRRLLRLGGSLPGALRRNGSAAHPPEVEAAMDAPERPNPAPDPKPVLPTPPQPPRRRRPEPEPDPFARDTGDPDSADLPGPELLTPPDPRDEALGRRELDELGASLIEKLRTFRISGEVTGRTSGPVVTQFEVSPAPGVKVARIASLEADLALALRAPSVRIVAPIPGKGAVGVEVPNPAPEIVMFREVLESDTFRGSRAVLPLALGKDISGEPYVADLARMPHLLIAGATGSGKSVCINTIITSLIYRHTPRTLRLLMVDPKMVELSMYNDLPHLRHPVVIDNEDAAGVLRWAVLEMERRYKLLSANGVRHLQDFNKRLESGTEMRQPETDEEGIPLPYEEGPLPFVVLVIDELADLMMTVQGEVEKPLAILAQKARAIGIHLILATQRPSVNVITGLIKANFPSRIAFRVSSKTDSRTILDQNGADNLLGNGDMLLLPPGTSEPVRIQGAYISTEDTDRLMGWYRERAEEREEGDGEEEDILDLVRASDSEDERGVAEEALEDRDALFREAAEVCIQQQGGSTSLLQRRLRIGYGRAARIIDQLHHAGVLGPPDGSRPREVLVDTIQLDRICEDDG